MPCILSQEENRLQNSEDECSILRIYGTTYQCSEATKKSCGEAEQALKETEDQQSKVSIFSNKGKLNENCFMVVDNAIRRSTH
jgi:hypothetical protein